MDILEYNSKAWETLTEKKDRWTVPVDSDTIARARKGNWSIQLTSVKPAPRNWFPDSLNGLNILCLAAGGGQQGPILAAAGVRVTELDYSEKQLAQDRFVAERENLSLNTIRADMQDLCMLTDESFDMVVNPCSNVFAENVLKVWKEASRVLKPGGILLAGFINPFGFIFDLEDYENGKLTPRHSIPYSDVRDLPAAELESLLTGKNQPVCFGHTLQDQIQGQLDAGLILTGFLEDSMGEGDPLTGLIDVLIATRAIKATL